jgi:3'-phosphoadenosine 5'-phosphosulfate sulfotransferase (PAPS reductase)/FAD synthetase
MTDIAIPQGISAALSNGYALALSISGGKDSQAMVSAVMSAYHANGWTGPVFAIHSHLGRAEWPQSLPHCEVICEDAGIPLVVVERAQGDLVDRLWERLEKLRGQGKPFWPSAANRYCTSDLKRNPINKHLRQYKGVISAEGIRSGESKTRCHKPLWEVRQAIQTMTRNAYTWNPIKEWVIADVWQACGTSQADLERRRALYRTGYQTEALAGWPAHPAYVFGNERVSCALCVLATRNDLQVGADHNPGLLAEYLRMEDESGYTFKQGFSLHEVAP